MLTVKNKCFLSRKSSKLLVSSQYQRSVRLRHHWPFIIRSLLPHTPVNSHTFPSFPSNNLSFSYCAIIRSTRCLCPKLTSIFHIQHFTLFIPLHTMCTCVCICTQLLSIWFSKALRIRFILFFFFFCEITILARRVISSRKQMPAFLPLLQYTHPLSLSLPLTLWCVSANSIVTWLSFCAGRFSKPLSPDSHFTNTMALKNAIIILIKVVVVVVVIC